MSGLCLRLGWGELTSTDLFYLRFLFVAEWYFVLAGVCIGVEGGRPLNTWGHVCGREGFLKIQGLSGRMLGTCVSGCNGSLAQLYVDLYRYESSTRSLCRRA